MAATASPKRLRANRTLMFVSLATLLLGCASQTAGHRPGPYQSASTSPSPQELFDGTVSGWRIAPNAVIDKEGLGRNLKVDCNSKEVHAETKTDLDFSLGYVPAGANSNVVTIKWICDGKALSVREERSFDRNGGTLNIERALEGPNRAIALDVPRSKVEPCTISGHPAVCVHPDDDASGRGTSYVIVIEVDTMNPYATVLSVEASEIPYADVLRVANELR